MDNNVKESKETMKKKQQNRLQIKKQIIVFILLMLQYVEAVQ